MYIPLVLGSMTDDESLLIDEFSVISEVEDKEEAFSINNHHFSSFSKKATHPNPLPSEILKSIKNSSPVYLKCPHCTQFTLTVLKHRPGLKSLLSCLGVGLVAWCGCCLVPCWMRACQDVIHCCGECGRVIAVVERKVVF